MKLIYRFLNLGANKYLADEVQWGKDSRQSYLVFEPISAISDLTIVFAYGGYWRSGSKEVAAFYGASLATKGYRVLVVDYRLYPQVTHPEFVYDVAGAINDYARQNPSAGKFVLAGHSAGGHIMALIAYSQQYRKLLSDNVKVEGYVAYAPALTFERNSDLLGKIFTVTDKRAWQPYVAGDIFDIPAYIFRAGFDEFVVAKSAEEFAQKINESGGQAKVAKIRSVEHTLLFAAMSKNISWLFPVRRKTLRYLKEIGAL